MATQQPTPVVRRAAPKVGKLTMRCPKCGGQEFTPPARPGVNSELTCKTCRARTKLSVLVEGNVAKEAQRLADLERPWVRVTPPIRIGKRK